MKNILGIVAGIIIIGTLYYYFSIKPEYDWYLKEIEIAKAEGFEPIIEKQNWELAKPWTWFIMPVTDIWFVVKNNYYRIDSSIIAGQTYHVNAEYHDNSVNIEVFDCKNNRGYILKKDEDITKIDFNKIEWNKYEKGENGSKLLEYLCSKNKGYYMMNVFGDNIDISNYIINGLYSLKDTTSKYISEINKTKPYEPTQKDEEIIQNGINEWLNKKYRNTFQLEGELYKKAHYKTSIMMYDRPIDIYVIDVYLNNEIGKIEIEFEFERFYKVKDYSRDEIMIHNE